MKIVKPLLFVLVVILTFSSCDKESIVQNGDDYFVVGSSHSSVAGHVNPTFLCNSKGAFRSNEYLRTKDLDSHTIELSAEAEAALKELVKSLPAELKNYPEDEKTFGCPGCADQPGYFVQFRIDNEVKTFIIDSYTSGFPDYLKVYAAKIQEVLPVLYK